VLVYATGFQATAWNWSVDICGRDQLHLHEAWKNGGEAYYGTLVAGFPNLFMVSGPNTSLGHNSQTIMIELQLDYIVRALQILRTQGLASIEVSQQAQNSFNDELQARLAKTSWADTRCSSWYKTPDGRITQNWGANVIAFQNETKNIQLNHFILSNIERVECSQKY